MPVIQAIRSLVARIDNKSLLIAIDGQCASGKTTLGRQLAEVFDCNLFHMDDFYLPLDMRTELRLSEPGGNVHYERFRTEVLDSILSDREEFSYGVFECPQMEITHTVHVNRKKINIIEGSYSQHPYFGDVYDLRICLTIDSEKQMQRILVRNGPEKAVIFQNRWIPFENRYLEAYGIVSKADIHIIA